MFSNQNRNNKKSFVDGRVLWSLIIIIRREPFKDDSKRRRRRGETHRPAKCEWHGDCGKLLVTQLEARSTEHRRRVLTEWASKRFGTTWKFLKTQPEGCRTLGTVCSLWFLFVVTTTAISIYKMILVVWNFQNFEFKGASAVYLLKSEKKRRQRLTLEVLCWWLLYIKRLIFIRLRIMY